MGRGGREGGRGPSRQVQISKALSLVLRHSAEKENIKINKEGYANVADLVSVTMFLHIFYIIFFLFYFLPTSHTFFFGGEKTSGN
jgi:hypothetical protein